MRVRDRVGVRAHARARACACLRVPFRYVCGKRTAAHTIP